MPSMTPTVKNLARQFETNTTVQTNKNSVSKEGNPSGKPYYLTFKPGDSEIVNQINKIINLTSSEVDKEFKNFPTKFPMISFDNKTANDVKNVIEDYNKTEPKKQLTGITCFINGGFGIIEMTKPPTAANHSVELTEENKTKNPLPPLPPLPPRRVDKDGVKKTTTDLNNIVANGAERLEKDYTKVKKAIQILNAAHENYPETIDGTKLNDINKGLNDHKDALEASEGWDKLLDGMVEIHDIRAARSGKLLLKLNSLSSKMDVSEVKINDLNAQILELEDQLSTATDSDEIKSLNENIKQLQQKCDIHNCTIADLKEDISVLNDEKGKLDADNTKLKAELSAAKNKQGEASSHIAELVAGIVALAASAAVFMVALIPKDSESSETTIEGSVDNSSVQAELQTEITELQTYDSEQAAAITMLDSLSDGTEQISGNIEQQIATLTAEQDAIVTKAGDQAYADALAQAQNTALQDTSNQVYTIDSQGHVVSTGELTPEAEAVCEAQAKEARAAAEDTAKQNIDKTITQLGQLDTRAQAAGARSDALVQQIATAQIATQARLDSVTALSQQIPDSTPTTTQNIENSNTNLSKAGFATALGTASALALGGTALIAKFAINSRKHKKDSAVEEAPIAKESSNSNVESTNEDLNNSFESDSFTSLPPEERLTMNTLENSFKG